MKSRPLLIQSPPRSSRSGTALIIASVILLSITPLLHRADPWLIAVAGLVFVAALLQRDIQAIHLAVFTVSITVMPLLHGKLRDWPFFFLVPVVSYLAVTLSVPRLRASLLQWLRPGSFGREVRLLVIMTAAISGVALYVWYRLLEPDLSIHLNYMPDVPVWLYPAAGLAFALGNAAIEEFVFRGVFMHALDGALGPRIASIIVQGWVFGAMHYLRGFPNGLWGVAMAAVYGIMLGTIRRRSQGMLAPWLAHVFADIVIFTIIAMIVLK